MRSAPQDGGIRRCCREISAVIEIFAIITQSSSFAFWDYEPEVLENQPQVVLRRDESIYTDIMNLKFSLENRDNFKDKSIVQFWRIFVRSQSSRDFRRTSIYGLTYKEISVYFLSLIHKSPQQIYQKKKLITQILAFFSYSSFIINFMSFKLLVSTWTKILEFYFDVVIKFHSALKISYSLP